MHRNPRGQILILTAVGLFVMLAVAALVIDVGFSWMLHRQEQNAADPGAIAAARWLRDSNGNVMAPVTVQSSMNGDACFYAQMNGFFVGDTNCSRALGTSQDLQVKSPPTSGPYVGTDGYVQVTIRGSHPAFFSRIFGQGQQTVATSAVAANTSNASNSSSLIALKNDNCGGKAAGSVSGGGTVRIFPTNGATAGGYVHVNQPCGTSTDNICANGVGESSLQISGTLVTPYAYVGGSCTYNGSGANGLVCATGTTSCLTEGALPLGDPLAGLPRPQLTDFPNGTCPDGTPSTPSSTSGCALPPSGSAGNTFCPKDTNNINVCHLRPGVFYGGWQVGAKVNLELDPGMYILAGGGISLSGTQSSIEAISSPTGLEARITIFSTDGPGCPSIVKQCQNGVTFSAAQAFQAKATNAATCGAVTPNTCPWRGILLWQDGSASNPFAPVKLGGQSSTILAGTIYAPKADVQIDGGQATTGCTGTAAGCLAIQIISWTWSISGGAQVDMPYDPAGLYQLPQRGLVH